ncbi:MAG: PLP-dependent aminotransferase family protein [Gemmatimonadales bacterium]
MTTVPRGRTGALITFSMTETEPGELRHAVVYREIRARIEAGRLPAGAALPSTRSLSRQLEVARSTVALAYAQLEEEGFITVRRGTPARVLGQGAARRPALRPAPPRVGAKPLALSRRGRAVAACPNPVYPIRPSTPKPFRISVPALDLFPAGIWDRLMSKVLRRVPAQLLSYGDARGLPELRQGIARHLAVAHGVVCEPEQVLVTLGSQQAIALVCLALTDPGDAVLIENPGYFAVRGALALAGARPVAMTVDDRGADVHAALAAHPTARLAIVTPGRQLPTGVSLSPDRRTRLLEWSLATGGWVLEDDYAGDLRSVTVDPPLRAEPGGERVLYAGTFSKVLFPALRLGYLVLPEGLVDAFARARTFLDFHPPHLEQAVMAAFLAEGHFDRHVRRVRTALEARRRALACRLTTALRGLATVASAEGSWHLLIRLPTGWSETTVVELAEAIGIEVIPLGDFVGAPARVAPGILLGFSGLRDDELRSASEALTTLLRQLAGRHRPSQ